MQTEVVAPALHARRREGHAEGARQHRQVLLENLLLEVLRARRDDGALAGEDGGNQIGQRLARARAGLGEQVTAVLERGGDGVGHRLLAGTGLEAVERAGERPVRRERAPDGADQAAVSG